MTAPRFVHLRLHSEYSITDGLTRLDDAVARAAADQMPALALTDLANLFGMVKFYTAARGAGIKPIIGADVWIAEEDNGEPGRELTTRLLLLAKNRDGYLRLCELLSTAYTRSRRHGRPEIPRSAIAEGDNAGRAWEKFSDGAYNDFGGILNPSFAWNIDVDLWIAAYYIKGVVSAVNNAAAVVLPDGFELGQNYPNPFNPSTSISLAIPVNCDVDIAVYNLLGQKVADVFQGRLNAGYHKFYFMAKNLTSGIYFYKVKAGSFETVKKMTLIK